MGAGGAIGAECVGPGDGCDSKIRNIASQDPMTKVHQKLAGRDFFGVFPPASILALSENDGATFLGAHVLATGSQLTEGGDEDPEKARPRT